MSIEITTQLIHASYASVIRTIDENANIYDNPNQQGTYYPAWFIVHRSPVELQKGIGRWTLVYQIDIWYMLKSNQTRLYDQYSAIAERLDDKLEYLPIFGTDACVHVLDRSWGLELDALKYSTTLRLYASKGPKPVIPYMEVIEDLRVFLKGLKQEFYTLSFTNTDHPDFTVELPDDIVSEANTIVKLPSVYAKEVIDDETWVPFAWDIGEFGQSVYMNENKVANLLWKVGEFVTLSFENVTYPQFDVEMPDPMLVEKGSNVTLPSVYGEFEEDGTTYIPENWDIGGFGESVTIELDTTAILLWRTVEPVGPVYPQGQFTYGEMQTNPDKQVELNAISFDADQDELMTATGNARDFIGLEFIPDAGFEFIMGLNGLMEIWTRPTEPLDIDVNFGDPVTIPAGYHVESVKCSRGYVFVSNVSSESSIMGQFVHYELSGEKIYFDDTNTALVGVGVAPALQIFAIVTLEHSGYNISTKSGTSASYLTSASASYLNSDGFFVKGSTTYNDSAVMNSVASAMQTLPVYFNLADSSGNWLYFCFNVPQTLWQFSGGVFSWLGNTASFLDLAYWYNGRAVRIHCVPA